MNYAIRKPSSLTLYEQYRPMMKCGDIVAFNSHTKFSELIKVLTHSPYSHVGMILREQSALFGETLLLIESTTAVQLADASGQQAIKGVQLHFLSQRLTLFRGSAFWVPLKHPLLEPQLEPMLTCLRNIYAEKVPYSYARVCGIPLVKFERLCGIQIKPNYSTLFCSELITHALQVAGVVDSSIDPASQTPADVTRFSCFDSPVQVKN